MDISLPETKLKNIIEEEDDMIIDEEQINKI